MELPRELWEGQNMKTVTHKYVNGDVDLFSPSVRGGGWNPSQTSKSTHIGCNTRVFLLNMIICSSLQVTITQKSNVEART